uniref:Uncharacterized protein n=1 Tax=Physcomitrium patens TaxID=3218 RepID=A0A2K1LAU8_PHYPA|nr:hypothetical protein PHYPA_001574 [Physcomitrium patens]
MHLVVAGWTSSEPALYQGFPHFQNPLRICAMSERILEHPPIPVEIQLLIFEKLTSIRRHTAIIRHFPIQPCRWKLLLHQERPHVAKPQRVVKIPLKQLVAVFVARQAVGPVIRIPGDPF